MKHECNLGSTEWKVEEKVAKQCNSGGRCNKGPTKVGLKIHALGRGKNSEW